MSKDFCLCVLSGMLTHLKSWTEHGLNRFFSADAIERFYVALRIIGGVKLHQSSEVFPLRRGTSQTGSWQNSMRFA